MSNIDLIRQRERDPETTRLADERAVAISKRVDPRMNTMLSVRARAEPDRRKKILWLRRLADDLVEAVGTDTGCTAGCSHCCNIPVVIAIDEARVIAKETGIAIKNPHAHEPETNLAYVGVPCPFLEAGRCSIYHFRPFACRVHFNLDRDGTLCQLVGEQTMVPFLGVQQWVHAYVYAQTTVQHADIRDYFGVTK